MQWLTVEESRQLSDLARQALRHHFSDGETPLAPPPQGRLLQPAGAFVSLHRGKDLRGCVGIVQPLYPLWETVRRCAVWAATRDPRFPPVVAEELPGLELEISVLGPLQRVSGPQQIRPGIHGVVVQKGPFHGLLLPQVALRMKLDAEAFLEQTCLKAGLQRSDWKKGATIQVFEVQRITSPLQPCPTSV